MYANIFIALVSIFSVGALALIVLKSFPWNLRLKNSGHKVIRNKEITNLKNLEIEKRLNEISKLKDGWLSDFHGKAEGKAIAKDEIKMIREILSIIRVTFLGDLKPYIYPTERGGVLVEWSTPDWEISIETNSDKTYTFYALNIKTDEEREFVSENFHYEKLVMFVLSAGLL
jgi:hypothetical protein